MLCRLSPMSTYIVRSQHRHSHRWLTIADCQFWSWLAMPSSYGQPQQLHRRPMHWTALLRVLAYINSNHPWPPLDAVATGVYYQLTDESTTTPVKDFMTDLIPELYQSDNYTAFRCALLEHLRDCVEKLNCHSLFHQLSKAKLHMLYWTTPGVIHCS